MPEDTPTVRALKLRFSALTSRLHNATLEEVDFPATIRELMAVAWAWEQVRKGRE